MWGVFAHMSRRRVEWPPSIDLRPFQRRFLSNLLRPSTRTAVLSMPRGNGKSTLLAHVCRRVMDPGDKLFADGEDVYLVANSLQQAVRTTFGIFRSMMPDDPLAYRFTENTQAAQCLHVRSRTKLTVLPASGKSASGIVRARLVVCDEPAAWHAAAGLTMFESIQGAIGKPGSRLKVVYIGTRSIGGAAPPDPESWWPTLIREGSRGLTYVQFHQGDPDRWDQWQNIRRANPLMSLFAESRAVLLEERDKARTDPRLRAAFLSDRLNVPRGDSSAVLLTVDDWRRVLDRPVAPSSGRPVCGVDLGGGRAWSSAVAVWPGGRTEAVALAPGIPDLERQEKRDGVTPGTYRRLADIGALVVAEGLRVPPVSLLVAHVREWGPAAIVCDRFRYSELQDSNPGCPIVPRINRWSNSTEDIRCLRRGCLDGPLSVAAGSRALVEASLRVATVVNDDSGNSRLRKSSNNKARDDVAQSWLLAAGANARRRPARTPRISLVG